MFFTSIFFDKICISQRKNNDKEKKAFQRLLNDLRFTNNLVLWEKIFKQSVVSGGRPGQERSKVFHSKSRFF